MANAGLSECPARVTVTCPIHNVEKINARRPDGSLHRRCRLCAVERLRKFRSLRRRKPDDPIKTKARKSLEKALSIGTIERAPCVRCGAPNAHAHHENYSRPLDVVWLCPLHHKARHREMAKEKAASPVTERRQV